MITTVIIDDEQESIDDLHYLIKKNKLPLNIIATVNSGPEGLAVILKYKPKLIFLDIVMPGMSGFEMLQLLPKLDFQLIITTSVDKYAIQAIRASALDFLLKPIKQVELINAVARLHEKVEIPEKSQLDLLQELFFEKNRPIKKIAIGNADSVELLNIEDILYMESTGNYTAIYLKNDRKLMSSKSIGKYEEIVSKSDFFRVHTSFLVNLNYVSKFVRSDGGYIELSNGKVITVSRRKKEEFLGVLSKM